MINNAWHFEGQQFEDPYEHIRNFYSIYGSFNMLGISWDVLCLALFPLTLREEVKQWANSLGEGEATIWDNLIDKFMKSFSPIDEARRRQDLITFEQVDSENLIDKWRRFKRMIKKRPHYIIIGCVLMEQFYFGLNRDTQQSVEAVFKG